MFASRDFECGWLLLLQARSRQAADAIPRQRVMIGGKEVVLPVGSYTASYVEKKVAEESQVGEPEQSPSESQGKGWKKAFNKVKLVDAGFIWTEPHSKRLKVYLNHMLRAIIE